MAIWLCVYGASFFGLGLAALFQMRKSSQLALSHQVPWLAAFAFSHSLFAWADLLLLVPQNAAYQDALALIRTIALPISGILLLRFAVGLILEMGPLPRWILYLETLILTPAALVVAYALVALTTAPDLNRTVELWSRYLLYTPASLIAGAGFLRHLKRISRVGLVAARSLLIGAAAAFVAFALVAGLIVPESSGGLASWLNDQSIEQATHIPAEGWRALSGIVLALLVTRALGVFEEERRKALGALHAANESAHQKTIEAQAQARELAESWLDAMVEISRQIATLEPLDAVLDRVVERARHLFQADIAAIGLWDEHYHNLIVKAAAGPGTNGITSYTTAEPAILQAARRPDMTLIAPETGWYCATLDAEVCGGAIAPLVFEGEKLGAIWVTHSCETAFSRMTLTQLEHLCHYTVIAIQRTLMAGRLQSLAIVEERGRIAREMHDGLAQILGYLSLEMQTIDALVQQGNPDATRAQIRDARERINVAQADVRENILSLRTTLAGDAGLIPSLQMYMDEFGMQTNIETQLVSEIDVDGTLSPLAEAQLVRIVQEALANVRKHAQASHVKVQLASHNGCLHVTVTDNGVGFDHKEKRRHFGLQTMRERAESVGGGLTVLSTAGHGTQITVWLPTV